MGTGGGRGTGGGVGTGGGGGAESAAIEQFCSSLTQLECDRAARCGLFQTSLGCQQLLGQDAVRRCARRRASVKDGRLTYDAALAAQCLQESAVGCGRPPSCGGVFSGRVPADGGCFHLEDCSPGASCDLNQGLCPGRCVAQVSDGAFTDLTSGCLPGLQAEFGPFDGGVFRCVPLASVGQPCSAFSACVTGLQCTDSPGVCQTPRGQGVGCSAADGGSLGSVCDVGAGLSCVGGACSPPAALGAPCGSCRFDLRCAPADGGRACQALGVVGEACAFGAECVTGLFCDLTGKCATPVAPGSTCLASGINPCVAGHHCGSSGRCELDAAGCADPTP